METDTIKAIGIDQQGSLWVQPSALEFPYVYRAGMGVYWDEQRRRLYSPTPQEWSYLRWFNQIRDAVRSEYGTNPIVNDDTAWSGVSDDIRSAVTSVAR